MDAPVHRQLTVRVQGRVQGVGFRYYTSKQARSLGLTGWVRNDRDGAVSFVAEGPVEALEALLQAVQRGPSVARVTDVSTLWSPATGRFDGFSVRYF